MFYAHNQMPAVASCATCSSFLLDTYSGAAAAYSLRKVKSTAIKSIRVRRYNTTDTLDIGFCGCDLDTAALAAFIATGSTTTHTAEILVWFDQSGNGRDVRISAASTGEFSVNAAQAGIIYRANGKPALHQLGSYYLIGSSFTYRSAFIAEKVESAAGANYVVANSPFTGGLYVQGTAVTGIGAYDGTNLRSLSGKDLNYHLAYWNITGGSLYVAKDGSAATNVGTFNLASLTGGVLLGRADVNNLGINGLVTEIILFSTEQSANKAAIEADMNAYYSIY